MSLIRRYALVSTACGFPHSSDRGFVKVLALDWWITSEAVSYTHLDVYKRQTLLFATFVTSRSFSKESSIRSTLSSHPAHTTSAIPISNTVKTESAVYQGSADKLSSLSPQQKSHLDHSDTDEEDWERIGAESLRNSRAASLIRSPNMVAASNFQADQLPSHLSLSPPALEPRSNKEESPKRESPKRDPPADTQDAAFLLMSLKS